MYNNEVYYLSKNIENVTNCSGWNCTGDNGKLCPSNIASDKKDYCCYENPNKNTDRYNYKWRQGKCNPTSINWIQITGDKGKKGQKGIKGLDGEKGTDGNDGDKGEKGQRGIRGFQGIDGNDGDKGNKGNKGNKGSIGDSIFNKDMSYSDYVNNYLPFKNKLNELEVIDKYEKVKLGNNPTHTEVEKFFNEMSQLSNDEVNILKNNIGDIQNNTVNGAAKATIYDPCEFFRENPSEPFNFNSGTFTTLEINKLANGEMIEKSLNNKTYYLNSDIPKQCANKLYTLYGGCQGREYTYINVSNPGNSAWLMRQDYEMIKNNSGWWGNYPPDGQMNQGELKYTCNKDGFWHKNDLINKVIPFYNKFHNENVTYSDLETRIQDRSDTNDKYLVNNEEKDVF